MKLINYHWFTGMPTRHQGRFLYEHALQSIYKYRSSDQTSPVQQLRPFSLCLEYDNMILPILLERAVFLIFSIQWMYPSHLSAPDVHISKEIRTHEYPHGLECKSNVYPCTTGSYLNQLQVLPNRLFYHSRTIPCGFIWCSSGLNMKTCKRS